MLFRSVEVGNHDEETDRLVVEIGEIDEFLVDDGFHVPHKCLGRLARHGTHPGEIGPCLVIDKAEIIGHLLEVPLVDVVEAVTRRLFQTLHSVVNALVEFTHPYVPLIGILVEIVLESVMLEQLLVIRRIVGVGIERLKLESRVLV